MSTEPVEPIMEHFEFAHLPAGLMRNTSGQFAALADSLCASLPRSAECTVALRKLLEGKDAAVRAARIAIRDAARAEVKP